MSGQRTARIEPQQEISYLRFSMEEFRLPQPDSEYISFNRTTHQRGLRAANGTTPHHMPVTLVVEFHLKLSYIQERISGTRIDGEQDVLHVCGWEESFERLEVSDDLATGTVSAPQAQLYPYALPLSRIRDELHC